MDATTLATAMTLATAIVMLITRIVEYRSLKERANKPKKTPAVSTEISKRNKRYDRFSFLSVNIVGIGSLFVLVILVMDSDKPVSNLGAGVFLGLMVMSFMSVRYELEKIRVLLPEKPN